MLTDSLRLNEVVKREVSTNKLLNIIMIFRFITRIER